MGAAPELICPQNNVILNSTTELIGFYDTYFNVKWFNKAARDSVGLEPEDFKGRRCFQIWNQSDKACPDCPVLKALETKTPQEGERQTADGRSWLVRGFSVFNDEGEVVAAAVFVQDITERKEAAREKAHLEARLFQSQKMESIGRLAGGVAHDFNIIMAVINGIADLGLMKMKNSPDPLYEGLFEEIKTAVDRSSDLTKQLLGFARRQEREPIPMALNDSVGSILKMLDRLTGSSVELLWMPGEEQTVFMDPVQLDQILAKLVINARDALNGPGIIRVVSGVREADEELQARSVDCGPGKYAFIRVEDNGCGIDEEVMSHMFEPFYSTKEEVKGTGLGLATVYGIVKQNKGLITVDSTPGEGAVFSVYLPVYQR